MLETIGIVVTVISIIVTVVGIVVTIISIHHNAEDTENKRSNRPHRK
ncbi:MAG: hypothetical protein IJ141_02590 [Lachnospiraceae bacterium]|nr:hypothetical protein [Lachnospiraceae bacterium]MBQ9234772.1 hypothetical protein [Lachnospiraceae bacterium]